MELEQISNHELLQHFKDAICQAHYNPSGERYNTSGFSLEELTNEIFRRMNNSYN